MTASWLTPAGPPAAEIATISWWMFGVAFAVLVAVLGTLLWAVWRPRRPEEPRDWRAGSDDVPDNDAPAVWCIAGAAAATVVILVVFLLLGLRTFANVLSPPGPAALTVEIVGHQWWWAVRYRAESTDVESANEIRVPVGQPVTIRLLSADVIHSFWVPQLQGKLDLVPGKLNVTWIQADRPGVYRGVCAEYCGLQHANMALLVIAEPPEVFAESLRRERSPAAPPKDEVAARGQRLFIDRGCASCHTIRGTQAFFGRLGPDLTHVASRRTLAAGTLTNVPGHLAGWIANPQALKPGNRMPEVPLEPAEVHALRHYLQALW
jgi:cytochrome c oxidase subunit II